MRRPRRPQRRPRTGPGPRSRSRMRSLAKTRMKTTTMSTSLPTPGAVAGQRVPVPLVKGNFHDAADLAEETLFGTDWCNIYQRGGMLVRPVLERMAAADDRETLAWQLTPVEQPYLMEMFERVASFMTFDRRYDPPRWVVTNCPDRIGKMVMARQGHWQAPILLGIVNTPPFRRDGTLMTTPGYDPNTWLLFNPDGEVFPEIPDRPTREQALARAASC